MPVKQLQCRVVKPDSIVQSFDPLCEVQSDKASVEITSPFDGIVKDLLVKEGDVARVGEGLCLIEVEEDVEEGATSTASKSQPPKLEPEVIPQPIEYTIQSPSPGANLHPLDPSNTMVSGRIDVLATPSVRYFARQKGVNLGSIGTGSGKGGRIEKKDVEAFLSSFSESSQPSMLPTANDGEIHVELGRTRFAMWKAMTKVIILSFPSTASLNPL